MEEIINKLTKESDEITIKIANLAAFKSVTKFAELSEMHQNLLIAQFNTMRAYSSILDIRIALLKKEKGE